MILFLGDGMGISTITAARILEGQMKGKTGEENRLAFESLPYTALSKTYSWDQQTSDSAPTMAAIVTGYKAREGMLSVNHTTARGECNAAAIERTRLKTILELAAAWQALSGFLDLQGLQALKAARPEGAGAAQLLRFSGSLQGHSVNLLWSPALGLPVQMQQRGADGLRVRYELVGSGSAPQPGWPPPDARSADYLHIDAADFGDMAYDPVVRKAEALDVLAGWRRAHAHE